MILQKIIAEKKKEIARAKRLVPLARLIGSISRLPKPRNFYDALLKNKPVAVIAEIKRRSPSKGMIRHDFRPEWIARRYEKNGAAALSVLTDQKFFGGSAQILKRVRRVTSLPVLRKDFMLEEYQIYESRAMGADAVLLIAAALDKKCLTRLSLLAARLGMAVLFEIHNESEWKKIKSLKPKLVGINNRDLKSFKVSLSVTERLARLIGRSSLIVAESGILTPLDARRMQKARAQALLVGESLMREKDPGKALRALLQ